METGRGGQQSCIAQTCALSMGVSVRGLEYFAVAIPPGTRSGVGRLRMPTSVGLMGRVVALGESSEKIVYVLYST